MKKLRYGIIALSMLLCSVTFAEAQLSIGIGLPNVSIGINLPLFPQLVRVPGYPVYYAPQVDGNFFFYDGLYWVYQNDNWYASSWYNGPWEFVDPEVVPLFVLRIPVSYYRQPPAYFHGWRSNAPPRWGQHWGHRWEQNRRGWDTWNHRSVPAPAPLPVYQRKYSGERYPRVEQQRTLHNRSYSYQPRDKVVRQHLTQQAGQKRPAPAQPGKVEPAKSPVQQHTVTRPAPPKQEESHIRRSAPAPTAPQRPGPAIHDQKQKPAAAPREQQAPRTQGQQHKEQKKGSAQDHGQGQDKNEERGRGHNK